MSYKGWNKNILTDRNNVGNKKRNNSCMDVSRFNKIQVDVDRFV